MKIQLLDKNIVVKRRPVNAASFSLKYPQIFFDTLLKAILLAVVAAFVYTILLYYCKVLWTLYTSTPIGMRYVKSFYQSAGNISDILNRDPLILSIRLTGLSLLVCFSIAAVCQFLHINRFLYVSRGFLWRIVFSGIPLAAVTAAVAQTLFQITHWISAFSVAILPTFCMFNGCFQYTQKTIPEIGNFFLKIRKQKVSHSSVVYLRPLHSRNNENLMEFDIVNGMLTGKKIQGDNEILINGIYSRKNRHDFFLYRYAGEFFFQYDDIEIVLNNRVNSNWSKTARWERIFELKQGDEIRLKIKYYNFKSSEANDIFYETNCLINDKVLICDEYLAFTENPSDLKKDQKMKTKERREPLDYTL